MKKMIRQAFAVSLALILTGNTMVFGASRFSDVPESHWAYSSIIKIADKGIMVGGTSGEYKPNNPIDKFDTSRILAVAAGYKYTNLTDAEKAEYNNAYEKNKGIFNSYKASFTKWNSSADKEIAYLLEKGIYTESDLAQFVIKNDNRENLRALSRQEAAVFLVRLIGKTNEALSANYSDTFSDDGKISQSVKPYVYYLKNKGVLAGDTTNSFNPNSAVTRAAMAVMLDKTLSIKENPDSADNNTSNSSNTDSESIQVETITGTIERVHTSLSAIQVKYSGGDIKIHKIDNTAKVTVDGAAKSILELKEGMKLEALSKNGTLIEVKATSSSSPSSGSETQTGTNENNNTSQNNSSQTSKTTVDQEMKNDGISEMELRTVAGTIVDAKSLTGGNKLITIEVKIISPTGGIISEGQNYTVTSGTKITRGYKDTDFSTVAKNDIVKAKVYGNKVYYLELEEKSRQLTGTVVDKRTESVLGTQYYQVEDKSGNVYEFVVNNDTVLRRKEMGEVKFGDIRIGDTIDLISEYANIVEAYAYGSKGYSEGIIKELHITSGGTYIMLMDDTGKTEKYYVIEGAFDVYTLRVNSRVRLKLDSKEVEAVSILQEAKANYYTGYISSISTRYFILRSTYGNTSDTIKVYYDSNTIVTDSIAGDTVSVGSLYNNMKVYVTFSDSENNARTITILSK